MGFIDVAKDFAAKQWPAWFGPHEIATDAYPFTSLDSRLAYLERQLMDSSFSSGDRRVQYSLNTPQQIRTAFKACAPLPTIVSQKAWAFTKGQVKVWNPKNKKEQLPRFKAWEQLFRNPNEEQGERQFFTQLYTYVQEYGYAVIDPTYPDGFYDRPTSMRIIPNWLFEIVAYNGKIVQAFSTISGVREELDVSRLIFIKDSASQDFDESTGLPYSRARVLDNEVSNVAAALNARGGIITDRGAQGLVTNTTKDTNGRIPLLESEKQQAEAYINRGGVQRRQNRLLFIDADLGYISTGFNSKDLQLQEESVTCLKTMCNCYGYPFPSLAEGFNGKYNSTTTGTRDFQDRTIEPEALDIFEQLSRGLGMYKDNCEAYMDYSDVASVQQSQKEKGDGQQAMAASLQTQWELGTVTRNDIREALGQERIERAEFNKYKWELDAEQQEQQNQDNGQAESTDQEAQ